MPQATTKLEFQQDTVSYVRRQICLLLWLIALLSLSPADAQPSNPAFSVASVRKNVIDDPRDPRYISAPDYAPRVAGERVTMRNSLAEIVAWAYAIKVKDYELVEGKWEKQLAEMYEIEAVANSTREGDLRAMLQQLLGQRFNLRVHRESREKELFDLIVSRKGPKLRPSPSDRTKRSLGFGGRSSWIELTSGARKLVGKGATMDDLAAVLSYKMNMPVRNQTNLAGEFDYDVLFTDNLDSVEVPGLTTAIRDMGLDLRKNRGKVDVVVVDSVESASEN